MGSASVQAIRAELLKIKGEVQLIQQQYKEHAEQRCEYQTKMAQLNQMVQQQTSTASQNNVMLVEDVIVVTLAAEHAAQCRYSQLPPPPDKGKANMAVAAAASTTGTTKNAAEAIQTYQAQIEMYQAEKTYREQLDAAETDMDTIYRQAVDEILDILEEYCDNVNLQRAVESFAASGNACSSPRHKCAGDKQTTLSRLLGTINPLSPRKASNSNTRPTEDLEQPSSPTATEALLNQSAHDSPKKTFRDIHQNVGMALKPLPLLVDDDEDKEEEPTSKEGVSDSRNNNEDQKHGGDDGDFHDIDSNNNNDNNNNSKGNVTLPEVSPLSSAEKKKNKTKKANETTAIDATDQHAESSSLQDNAMNEVSRKVKKKKSKTKQGSEGFNEPEMATDQGATSRKTKKKKTDKTADTDDGDAKVNSNAGSIDATPTKTPKKKKSSKTSKTAAAAAAAVVEEEAEEACTVKKAPKTKEDGKGNAEVRAVKKKKIKNKPKDESASETVRKKKKKEKERRTEE